MASQKSQPKSRGSSVTEHEIIDALSEHAQKIAEQVLSRPHTGQDLAEDAQVSHLLLACCVAVVSHFAFCGFVRFGALLCAFVLVFARSCIFALL